MFVHFHGFRNMFVHLLHGKSPTSPPLRQCQAPLLRAHGPWPQMNRWVTTQQLFLAAVPKKTEQRRWVVVGAQNLDAQNGTLWLFNIAMEAMAHRNRWFTY